MLKFVRFLASTKSFSARPWLRRTPSRLQLVLRPIGSVTLNGVKGLRFKRFPSRNRRFLDCARNDKIFVSHYLGVLGLLLVCSLLLTACTVYNGYPTATALPVKAINATSSATTAPAADYPTPTPEPDFPTVTARATLPPAPTGINSTKQNTLTTAFGDLMTDFYHSINSADLYEVGLRGMIDTLKQAGIADPQVPIPDFTGDATQDGGLFTQAYLLTLAHYQNQISEDKLAYGAIEAAASSLQECHTAFYTPDKATDFVYKKRGLDAQAGLGVMVLPGNNGLVISHVLPQSPADKAGLKMGDTITTVDGQDLTGKNLNDAIGLLRGGTNPTAGTTTVLKVLHAASTTSNNVTLTRGQVTTLDVESQVINNDTGYIRFNAFPLLSQTNSTTALQQLDKSVSDLTSQNLKGIVLDVRGNSNGSIRTVQNYISRFVGGSQLVFLQTQDKPAASATPGATATVATALNTIVPMPASGDVKPISLPMAVLVDAGTAGEAEIFAYTLQSQKVARVFGTFTNGCTTASSPVGLDDNSVLNIATYRPVSDPNDPTSVVRIVNPDVQVDMDVQALQQGHDSQLDKAVQFLEGK